MICGQKANSPSCVARHMAMIMWSENTFQSCNSANGHDLFSEKTYFPSCATRQKAVICGKFVQFKQMLVEIKDYSSPVQVI